MSKFMKVLLVISLSLFSLGAFAEALIEVIAKKQPDTELTILGMTVGKSTLDEVKAKFKSKDFYREGDAGESLSVLCFKSSNGSTIAFESGEMGGSEHKITSISINSPKKAYRLNKICEKTSLIKSKLVINGVSLGLSPDLIKMVTGKPSKQSSDHFLYQYEAHDKSDKGQIDTVSRLEIEFVQDAVAAFNISKVETY